MGSNFDLVLRVSDTEVCTSNQFMGLGGLLITLEKGGVEFIEVDKYNPVRAKMVQKECISKIRRTDVGEFCQFIRLYGPQFNPETVDSIIEKADLDSKYLFLRPYSSGKRFGMEIAMTADYSVNFDR